MYVSIRPSQSGCDAMPTRTNTFPVLSSRDLGRIAEYTPTERATSIHTRIPPATSDAVAGHDFLIRNVTSWPVRDRPSSPWTMCPRKLAYSALADPVCWKRVRPSPCWVVANELDTERSGPGAT